MKKFLVCICRRYDAPGEVVHWAEVMAYRWDDAVHEVFRKERFSDFHHYGDAVEI